VTDNSSGRVLDNIERAAAWGAEVAMVAAPPIFPHASPTRILGHFQEIVRHSVLPVGFYDGGETFAIPEALLPEFLDEPKLVLVKDSSALESRIPIYAASHRRRPELLLLDGDEFACIKYLEAGYDGLLLGGGVFNARLAGAIVGAIRNGDRPRAEALQKRMNDLMYRVYGGVQIECWLAGLKELLVEMGIFSTPANLLGYTLIETCRRQIRDALSGADGLDYRTDLLGPQTSPVGGPKSVRAQTSA
jgi:4-hydroxy-tetrahydrodipicolinate synthase